MALVQARGRLECSFNGVISSGLTTTANGALGTSMLLGARRNLLTSFTDSTFAIPNGHLASSAWFMPQKDGGMSSINEAVIVFTETGNAAQGYNASSSTSFTFTANGNGAAVAAAVGSASFVFSASGSAVAPFQAVGSASFTFSASASLGGTALIVGSSAFIFTGTLTTGAIGHMNALPIDTALTADSIASSVWAALASANNTAGTMGAFLNAAGAGGDPWAVTLEGSYTAADLIRIISASVAGKVSGAASTTIEIRDVSDSKNRIVATVDADGNRTAIVLDGA